MTVWLMNPDWNGCNMIKILAPRLLSQFAAALFGVLFLPVATQAATYKSYAVALVRNLPDGAQFRPDLEAALLGHANAYRASKGSRPLFPSDLFLIAARAQAADMMINDFVGHRSSTGHDFDSRMRVFVGDTTRFPAMAENAARQSQDTPVDGAKLRKLFQQWIDSRPHRKALVSRDYAFVSTAVVQRGNTIWAVQIFWAKPREKGLFQ